MIFWQRTALDAGDFGFRCTPKNRTCAMMSAFRTVRALAKKRFGCHRLFRWLMMMSGWFVA